jgi:hypothetical protein
MDVAPFNMFDPQWQSGSDKIVAESAMNQVNVDATIEV